jgi:hypothetical protein
MNKWDARCQLHPIFRPRKITVSGSRILKRPRSPRTLLMLATATLKKRQPLEWVTNGVLMTLNSGTSANPTGDQHRSQPGSAHQVPPRFERIQSLPAAPSGGLKNWNRAPFYKQLLLAVSFLVAFLLLDGSSAASQSWEGAPTWYLPVGLTVALLLWGGMRYLPLVVISALVAAMVNYHRPIISWCGAPGATGVYVAYIGGVALLRGRWRIDPRLGNAGDVGRFTLVLLSAAVPSALIGSLTLLEDHLIHRSDFLKTMANWWASDAISILSFTPFLLLYVAPRVHSWMMVEAGVTPPAPQARHLAHLETTAQAGSALVAIWIVFGFAQPFRISRSIFFSSPSSGLRCATVCPEQRSPHSRSTSE